MNAIRNSSVAALGLLDPISPSGSVPALSSGNLSGLLQPLTTQISTQGSLLAQNSIGTNLLELLGISSITTSNVLPDIGLPGVRQSASISNLNDPELLGFLLNLENKISAAKLNTNSIRQENISRALFSFTISNPINQNRQQQLPIDSSFSAAASSALPPSGPLTINQLFNYPTSQQTTVSSRQTKRREAPRELIRNRTVPYERNGKTSTKTNPPSLKTLISKLLKTLAHLTPRKPETD